MDMVIVADIMVAIIIIGMETIGTMVIIITTTHTLVEEEAPLLMVIPQMVEEMEITQIHLTVEEEEVIHIVLIQQLETTITEVLVPIQTLQHEVILQ